MFNCWTQVSFYLHSHFTSSFNITWLFMLHIAPWLAPKTLWCHKACTCQKQIFKVSRETCRWILKTSFSVLNMHPSDQWGSNIQVTWTTVEVAMHFGRYECHISSERTIALTNKHPPSSWGYKKQMFSQNQDIKKWLVLLLLFETQTRIKNKSSKLTLNYFTPEDGKLAESFLS